jgi:hypothetical protein
MAGLDPIPCTCQTTPSLSSTPRLLFHPFKDAGITHRPPCRATRWLCLFKARNLDERSFAPIAAAATTCSMSISAHCSGNRLTTRNGETASPRLI